MTLGMLILLGIVVVVLVIGLLSILTSPLDIDEEEKEIVEKEIEARKKKRWWRRS